MKILVFGDSIVQGFFDAEGGGWCNRLIAHTNKKTIDSDNQTYVSAFNLGVSGDCTNRLLERFDHETSARTKNNEKDLMIVFSIGVNDTQRYVATEEIKTPIEQFEKNLEALHLKASKYTDRIMFLGILPIIESMVQPMPWADDRGHQMKDVIEFSKTIQLFCNKKNCTFIAMQKVFEGHDLKEVLIDGIHPNTKGHALIFEKIKTILEEQKSI